MTPKNIHIWILTHIIFSWDTPVRTGSWITTVSLFNKASPVGDGSKRRISMWRSSLFFFGRENCINHAPEPFSSPTLFRRWSPEPPPPRQPLLKVWEDQKVSATPFAEPDFCACFRSFFTWLSYWRCRNHFLRCRFPSREKRSNLPLRSFWGHFPRFLLSS